MKKLNILFASAEVLPYAATGGLGEVAGSLPRALNATGRFDARVIMPLYGEIPAETRSEMRCLGSRTVTLAWRRQYCGIFSHECGGVTTYFIDNEYYFRREGPGLYGYYDDGERYAFFCRAVADTLDLLGFAPNLIHANDWQCAMLPVYLSRAGRACPKTVFTIHNIEYQGKFDKLILGDVFGLPESALPVLEWKDDLNLMKAAIETAHSVTTVSPTYAQELQDAFYAHGLEEIIKKNARKLRGILNGIDTVSYDPAADDAIFARYSADDMSGKAIDKAALQRLAGLPEEPDVPLVAIVSRLVEHKGMDLVQQAAEDLLHSRVQLLVLGKGDLRFEEYFRSLARRCPTKAAALITYNKDLSHKVYAGADIFLMPSRSEPCGLSQMIACRYGTIPVVRATGGLADSIVDCGAPDGFGFCFSNYDADSLQNALRRALTLYGKHNEWAALRRRAMRVDFSWERSAGEYAKLYEELAGQ